MRSTTAIRARGVAGRSICQRQSRRSIRRVGPRHREIRRIDDEQREQHGDHHVARDRDRRGQQTEQRQIGAHPADVDREERRR